MEMRYEIRYNVVSVSKLEEEYAELVNKAVAALSGSHSKYSEFCVGAAVLLENKKVFCGSNQENVSFPCSTCAERSALNYAQSVFPDINVSAIAIVAQKRHCENIEEYISPCGLCRQVLVEVETRQKSPIKIILAGCSQVAVFDSADDLLPFAFRL